MLKNFLLAFTGSTLSLMLCDVHADTNFPEHLNTPVIVDRQALQQQLNQELFPKNNQSPYSDLQVDFTQVLQGNRLLLDASQSYDPEGGDMTYTWTVLSQPQSSQMVLEQSNHSQTSFIADKAGEYIIAVTVSDGFKESAWATVKVSVHFNDQIAIYNYQNVK